MRLLIERTLSPSFEYLGLNINFDQSPSNVATPDAHDYAIAKSALISLAAPETQLATLLDESSSVFGAFNRDKAVVEFVLTKHFD